jgi:hypothetical protein
MKRFLLLLLLFTSCGLLANTHLATRKNCVVEWTYQSTRQYANPFREIQLDALVTTPSGKELRVPAFWAGGNNWSFRYASPEMGIHQFRTVCSDEDNQALHGRSGSIDVLPYEGDNLLYRHGPLRVAEDGRQFCYRDGTPFFWLADQWWHGMTTRFKWPEDFHTLTSDRKEKGFSVVGFAVGFPCDIAPFDPRGQNEAGDPWTDSGFTSINPAYFDLTDQRIFHLLSEGLVPNIMGSWGYYIDLAGVENMKLHYRYLIARYGAFPITWTLAGEVTLAYYTELDNNWEPYKEQFRREWSEVGRYLQQYDPYDRLVTVHPGPGIWDGKPPLDDMQVVDFIFLQSGHSGFHTLPRAVSQVKENLLLYPDRPVLHGEVCFEGMQASSRDDIQRFLFWSNLLSGTAGFSYGVEGIWQFNTQEELFGASPVGNVWGNVPWEEACHYPGSEQLGLAKRFLEKFDYWLLEPCPERILSNNPQSIFAPYGACIPGKAWTIYLNQKPSRYNPYTLTGLKPGKAYTYMFMDPVTGTEYPEQRFRPDTSGEWKIPGVPVMQDFVLVVSPHPPIP